MYGKEDQDMQLPTKGEDKVTHKYTKESMTAQAQALAKYESLILQQSLHIFQEAVPCTQSAPLSTSVGVLRVKHK